MPEKAETMPPERNEVDKFFEGLPQEENQPVADIFGETQGPVAQTAETPAEGDEPRKNRRHRRLEQQLEKEREARIAAEARAAGYADARQESQESNSQIDERLLRMYGADGMEAAKLHSDLLNDYATKAEERAMQRFEAQQQQSRQEEAQATEFIDAELEAIEDEYGVDVTSDAPAARKARREFLTLVEKLSPKDSEGKVTDFADFDEAWEVFQSTQKKPDTTSDRAKEIAGRTMENSGNTRNAPRTPTAGFDGWKTDFGLN